MEKSKLDKEISLEDENICTWHLGRQEYQVDSGSFLESKGNRDAVRTFVEFNGFVTREDSLEGRDHTALYAKSQLEAGWMDDRTGLYTDVSNIDCEMPELVVFCKGSDYQIVKDICIDRNFPSQKKCSVENCELDHNIISCLLNSDVDVDNKTMKEALKAVSTISIASESFSDQDCNKGMVKRFGSTNFLKDHEVDLDASVNIADGSSTKNLNGRLLEVRELDANYSHSQFSDSNGHRGDQKIYKVLSKRAILATSTVSSTTEAPPHSNNEGGYVIEPSFESDGCDSSLTTISQREGNLGNKDGRTTVNNVKVPRLEDEVSESSRMSSQIYDHGNSSFSAVSLLSGPEECSGRIPYSGSISLRSNSSNSIRSFTFPILPSEWNGSPIRMVEVDKRARKKRKPWTTVFHCCKS